MPFDLSRRACNKALGCLGNATEAMEKADRCNLPPKFSHLRERAQTFKKRLERVCECSDGVKQIWDSLQSHCQAMPNNIRNVPQFCQKCASTANEFLSQAKTHCTQFSPSDGLLNPIRENVGIVVDVCECYQNTTQEMDVLSQCAVSSGDNRLPTMSQLCDAAHGCPAKAAVVASAIKKKCQPHGAAATDLIAKVDSAISIATDSCKCRSSAIDDLKLLEDCTHKPSGLAFIDEFCRKCNDGVQKSIVAVKTKCTLAPEVLSLVDAAESVRGDLLASCDCIGDLATELHDNALLSSCMKSPLDISDVQSFCDSCTPQVREKTKSLRDKCPSALSPSEVLSVNTSQQTCHCFASIAKNVSALERCASPPTEDTLSEYCRSCGTDLESLLSAADSSCRVSSFVSSLIAKIRDVREATSKECSCMHDLPRV